jgi:DNA-binding PadR family transcriptional regulator
MKAENLDSKIRFFKAFADLAILAALQNQPLTGYGINQYFMKKVGYIVSPSIIYANLILLERQGLVGCAGNRKPRLYKLTQAGRKTADRIPRMVKETNMVLDKILET